MIFAILLIIAAVIAAAWYVRKRVQVKAKAAVPPVSVPPAAPVAPPAQPAGPESPKQP